MNWFAVKNEGGYPSDDVWTISRNPEIVGWKTDGGYHGYGLPKNIVDWIVEQLNKSSAPLPHDVAAWVGGGTKAR